MRRSRVTVCLASSTQQMNSLRAKGVMSFQASSAALLTISASRRSRGSSCTTPPGTGWRFTWMRVPAKPAVSVSLPCPKRTVRSSAVRLLVARCEVLYTGRLTARLPEAVRLLMFKPDGSFLVHDDAGGYRPLNWMTPPTVVEEDDDVIVVRKRAGKTEDRLEGRLLEVLSDVTHPLHSTPLEKDGVERPLQEELAAQPHALGERLQLVRREWPTDIGPVDLMCRDEDGLWVAVEIKRVGTIDAVEQLGRYLERIELEECRGVLAAQTIKPQARTLAESRGIRCVEVDLAVLRGEREPDLTLFAD